MATMKLDIGGAETHIVELSKALARRGVEIFVASGGGAYVAELEAAGIKHFKVGLYSKSPRAMKAAYDSLKRIIFENKIDVVHAHARIPGFLCGLLSARYKFRFVTTAHWVFDTRFPFRLLTDWGDRTLAVSDDIKKYLMDNYGCPEENILVTINGVDTEKFSANVDWSDVAKEFGFGRDRRRVVYVSRMDTDRSLAAHKLIEAAPKLYAAFPDLEIVIVGGGNDLVPIESEAKAANERMGARVIITTGARCDINKFVASGDVFVGVSRAALEAMACEKPAIIAGNEGYIGIFDENRLQAAIDTNFCCRGFGETTCAQLCEDLQGLLGDDAAERRRRLGQYSLETVKKHYSVDTMANDALKMYISEIKDSKIGEVDAEAELADIERYLPHGNSRRTTDVLISGYYGFHNSGDDSILAAIIGELRRKCPTLSITVLSKTPAETAKVYGVRAINRIDVLGIVREMKKTKLLISGGGSLLQDVTSTKSLKYYIWVIRLAKRLGAKVMLYANGIGPILREQNEKAVKKALSGIDAATLRDEKSLSELKRLGVSAHAELTADPVYSMAAAEPSDARREVAKTGVADGTKYFVIAVREWKSSDPQFLEKLAAFSEHVSRKFGIVPLILPMQGMRDRGIAERLSARLDMKHGIIRVKYTPEMLLGIVGNSEFVLGMRLHTLIYAAKTGTPVIALSYDPKVSAMMKESGQKYEMPVESIDVNMLCGYADEIMERHGEISRELLAVGERLCSLAERNADVAVGLLRGASDEPRL